LVGDDQVLGGEGCADVGGGLVGALVGGGEVADAVALGEGAHVSAQALGAGGGADVFQKQVALVLAALPRRAGVAGTGGCAVERPVAVVDAAVAAAAGDFCGCVHRSRASWAPMACSASVISLI